MTAPSLMDIVYVGFNSRVAALHREDGSILWKWKAPKGGSSHVAVMLDGDRLMVSVHGYTYCLDPLTGEQLWNNPMSGFGFGYPSLASFRGSNSAAAAVAAMASDQSASTGGAT